eukprot:SAG22_NODE_9786_length_569_cov_1.642553_1_plen_90_part_01
MLEDLAAKFGLRTEEAVNRCAHARKATGRRHLSSAFSAALVRPNGLLLVCRWCSSLLVHTGGGNARPSVRPCSVRGLEEMGHITGVIDDR